MFEHGRFTAVMGPSGSGKSTLMHCMAGLDRPTGGPGLRGGPRHRRSRRHAAHPDATGPVGFVFQSFNLVPTLTAGENITLPVDLAGRKVDKEWFDYLVGQLGIADRLSHRPNEMSGGQQQRCACARALINRPDLVFADEPTGNLDSNSTNELLGFLRRSVTEFGQSIVDGHPRPARSRRTPTGSCSWPTGTSWTSSPSRPPTRSSSACGRWAPDMWSITIKGLLAHKLRLVLTALAIVLGVTFIAGTFVLTDTLNNTFNTLFDNIYQKVDFQVRGVAQFNQSGGGAPTQPDSRVAAAHECAPCPGWRSPRARCTGCAQFVGHDGTAISTGGAPDARLRWDPNQQLSPLRLVASGPRRRPPHEVVMDLGTAQKHDFKVGQQVRILLQGPTRTFTISGLVRFGTANNLAGATLAAFNLPTAQSSWATSGNLDAINVLARREPTRRTVQRAIAQVLPRGVEVVTGQTVINEQTSQISKALGFFSTALLVFAFIALFVGGFTIFNTFSIIVGQRTRELALLRIVGASRRQVFRSVLGEAAIVGLVASHHRPRPRRARRARARGAAQRLRGHAAVGAARLRGAHRHRLPAGGRGRHASSRRSARPAARCASPRSPRSPSSRPRTEISTAPALHLGRGDHRGSASSASPSA